MSSKPPVKPPAPPSADKPLIPPGATVIRRRSYKRPLARPFRGWALIVAAAVRLKSWDQLSGCLAQQVFATVCHKCAPHLEPLVRAEKLWEDTLHLRMDSSATVATFHYVKDIVLAQLNEELRHIADKYRESYERAKSSPIKEIKRFKFAVGNVKELPDYKAWTGKARRAPTKKRPVTRPDVEVMSTIGKVENDELRDALRALYAAATARP